MSIVFLSPTGQAGGAEAVLQELFAGLREAQPSWSLDLIVASDGPLVARAAALGIPVRVLPFPRALARLGEWGVRGGYWPRVVFLARCVGAAWPTLAYLRQLRRLLRAQQPDIVHTNGFKMHLLGAWARPRGSAVLWHLHDYVGRRPFTAGLFRRSVRRCSVIVANSQSVAADARRVCGTGVTVHAVWNAVDLDRFSPRGPHLDLDALSGLPAGEGVLRVGLVATFAGWKGHETFLKALAMLPAALSVRGYVIGGAVYETEGSQVSLDELREQAASLGLGSRVGFTGFVQDSSVAMRSLDIVVHASTEPEPFGLVIAEAMACGKPVVASRAAGALELTDLEGDSLVHTPGDAQALAQAIETLARDAGLRQRLGDAGRAKAEQCFSRPRLAGDFAPIYQALRHEH